MMNRIALALTLALAACGGDSACDPEAPDTICTIAGNGDQGFDGDGKNATDAALYVPQDTTISPDGEVWLLDFNNYLVRAIDASGKIRTVAGNGLLGDSPAVGVASVPALEAPFNHTTDLLFHDGYLYLAAWHNSYVKRIDLATMELSDYAGRGIRLHYDGDEGDALKAAVDLPSSLTIDPAGNLVIMDQANQVIRMIDRDHKIHRIAGSCVIDDFTACAEGQVPTQCPDSNKTTCGDPVAECGNQCTPGYGGDGGPALAMRMAQPYGQQADPAGRLAYDHVGNLYFADTDNNRIRKIDATGIVTTVAGDGEPGYAGDGGPAAQSRINRPVDVTIGDDDSVYFTDVYNNCVRKIALDGTISAVVGQCSDDPADRGFAGDGGPPLEAKLDRPYGVDIHGKRLYVSDSYNNRIRVVNLP